MDGVLSCRVVLYKAEAIYGKVFATERIVERECNLLACVCCKVERELVPVSSVVCCFLCPAESIEQSLALVSFYIGDVESPFAIIQEVWCEVSIELYLASFFHGKFRTCELSGSATAIVANES